MHVEQRRQLLGTFGKGVLLCRERRQFVIPLKLQLLSLIRFRLFLQFAHRIAIHPCVLAERRQQFLHLALPLGHRTMPVRVGVTVDDDEPGIGPDFIRPGHGAFIRRTGADRYDRAIGQPQWVEIEPKLLLDRC